MVDVAPRGRAFGELLKRYRVSAGLTQEQLAERAFMSARAVSDLERGINRTPRRDTVRFLIEALAVADDDIEAFERAALPLPRPSRRTATPTTSKPTHTIAPPPTPLVGREEEIASLRDLLLRLTVRLVTVTGPGGVGKTRLALHVAADSLDAFPDGIYAVDLAPIEDASLVATAVSATLPIRSTPGSDVETTLTEYLRDKRVLLLLDNFEHLIPAAGVVSRLLSRCPRLSVFVTSRSLLRLSGEYGFALAPFEVPADLDDLDPELVRHSSAIALFLERARAARPTLMPDEKTVETVARICRRLDGLPLAIELAAARTRLFSVDALLARLGEQTGQSSLVLLAGGPRDVPERQQALRDTIAWSVDLLDGEEQALFRRLAVFSGGWTIESAGAVTQEGDDVAALDGIQSLADQSLVYAADFADPDPRFSMLRTIRDYALSMLEQSDEEEDTRRSHAEYFAEMAKEAEAGLTGTEQVALLTRLEREIDNIRAALAWSLDHEPARGMNLATALWRFWYARGHLTEGRDWLERFLKKSTNRANGISMEEQSSRVNVTLWAGALAADQGDYEHAASLAQEGLALSRATGNAWGVGLGLNVLGNIAHYTGNVEEAQARYSESLDVHRDAGNQWGIALSLNNLGAVARERGELMDALNLYEQSVAVSTEIGDLWSIAISVDNMSEIARERGDLERAKQLAERSLAIRREMDDTWGIADSLLNLAQIALEHQDFEHADNLFQESLALYRIAGDTWRSAACLEGLAGVRHGMNDVRTAARLLGAAASLRESIGAPLSPADAATNEHLVATMQSKLGEHEFEVQHAAGRLKIFSLLDEEQPSSVP